MYDIYCSAKRCRPKIFSTAWTGTCQYDSSLSEQVFRRSASGLVREMSSLDVALWGFTAAGIYVLYYFMPFAQVFLPGADLGLAVALCLVVMVPLYALYAGLGSSMPRAGGDYVYQSRILHPAIGLAFPLGWFTFFWIATYVAFGGFILASLGLAPIFLLVGLLQNNSTLIGWASWIQAPEGQFATCLGIAAFSLVLTIVPLKWWTRSQRYVLLPTTVITNVVLIYLLGTSTPESFHQAFNYWGGLMGSPQLYESVVEATTAAGYSVPAFSWRSTLLLMSVVSVYLAWVMWSSQGMLGEVKRADDFRRLFTTYLSAGLYLQWIAYFIPIQLFSGVVGWDFVNRIANAYYLPNSVVPFYPSITLFSAMLTTNPILIVLVSLGLVTGGFFAAACVFVIVPRIWIAMSLDRLLPSWFGSVDRRTHTPIWPTVFCIVVSLIAAYLFLFWPPFYSSIVVGSVVGPTGVVFVTAIAAILFRRRRPEIFEASPVARYRIGGVALIEIVGAISAIVAFSLVATFLTAPELGYNVPVPILYTFGILIACFVLYFANSAYQRSKGMDISLAFRELPPI